MVLSWLIASAGLGGGLDRLRAKLAIRKSGLNMFYCVALIALLYTHCNKIDSMLATVPLIIVGSGYRHYIHDQLLRKSSLCRNWFTAPVFAEIIVPVRKQQFILKRRVEWSFHGASTPKVISANARCRQFQIIPRTHKD